jgi:hypothetical protein
MTQVARGAWETAGAQRQWRRTKPSDRKSTVRMGVAGNDWKSLIGGAHKSCQKPLRSICASPQCMLAAQWSISESVRSPQWPHCLARNSGTPLHLFLFHFFIKMRSMLVDFEHVVRLPCVSSLFISPILYAPCRAHLRCELPKFIQNSILTQKRCSKRGCLCTNFAHLQKFTSILFHNGSHLNLKFNPFAGPLP